LQDGHLDQDEADDLLDLFSQLTGENPDFCASVNLSTSLPFTRPIPEIVFPRCTFCLTGRFALGPRKECEKEIKSLGGVLSKNVTMKTEYVVIGSIGSEAWIHSNYGRKIEKAVEYREKGHNVAIVPEDLWVQAMTG
jgi:NAD-dependent DNA ligase